MATQVLTQNQTRGAGQRGRRGNNRGTRGGNRGGRNQNTPKISDPKSPKNEEIDNDLPPSIDTNTEDTPVAAETTEEVDDSAICFICAEPIKYYAVSQCNHRTCHVCALRLRALYKKTDCTFCKEPQAAMIFTVSPDAPWTFYQPDAIPYKDGKLAISFETQEMMEDSLILLRFNCPDTSCDYIANGWSDLKLHTRATHGKLMCDLCIRNKKIFAHEHALYHPNQLPIHLPSMRGANKHAQKDQIEGGVHPLCEFCRECFFGSDELYAHMREKHEECFICKRNDVRDQYFRNYDALEQHFNNAHHPCNQPVCKERKFVVFGSVLDLKAHMVEEHGADMSAKDKRDTRRIQADFEFEEVGVGGRRGGRRDREREHEPPPIAPSGPPGPSRSLQNNAGARRREAFGGNLTTESNSGAPANAITRNPSPPLGDGDSERTASVLARVSTHARNPTTAGPVVKSALRSFTSSESGSRDLISTIWNVLDQNLEGTASVVNAIVDILEEEDKKHELLSAWNGFKVEQRNQFPALIPTGTGDQWAGITAGRLLNAKQTTASRSRGQSSNQVLARVARAASSSAAASPAARPVTSQPERFPALQGSSSTSAPKTSRQAQRNTPWAKASIVTAPPPAPRGPLSVPGPGARSKSSAPVLSNAAFPGLPPSNATKVPKNAISGNQSLRNILGDSVPTSQVWGTGSGKSSANASGVNTPSGENGGEGEAAEAATGKGKKGKGKQKQTLFTLGSFPT